MLSNYATLSNYAISQTDKRLKTQRANVRNLKNKVLEQEENIAELQIENDNLSEKLEEALRVRLKLRKKKIVSQINLPNKILLQKFFCSLMLMS